MATLTGKQLKDSYQGLLTIKTADDANPLSGRLENGLGNAITNLGIGTDSPANTLSVFSSGASAITIIDVVGGSSGAGVLQLSAGTTLGSSSFDIVQNSAGAFLNQRDNNLMSFYVNNDEKIRIEADGDIAFYDDANNQGLFWDASTARLGIGTNSPSAKLHVNDTTYPTLRLSTATSHSNIYHDGTTGSIAYSADDVNAIAGSNHQFYVDGASAMNLDGTGLGIGTTSPASLLSGANVVVDVGNSSGGEFIARRSGGEANLAMGVTSGNIGYLYSTTNTPMVFGVNNAERMRIDSSGNVGIGVTPEAWTVFNPVLRIKNASTGGGGALAGTGVDNFRMFANTYYDGAYKRLGTGYATQYEQGSGTHVWSTASSGAGDSTITWSESMRIDSSGQLGISETNPTAPLQIKTDTSAGNAKVAQFLTHADTTSGTEVRLAFAAHTNTDIATDRYSYISALNTSGSNGQALVFATNAAGAGGSEKMRIDSSGNVLVGKDAAALATVGTSLFNDGTAYHTVDGNVTMRLNRLTDDGTIIDLRKDTTTVGSIGTIAGYTYIGSTVGDDAFISFGANTVSPATSTGGGRDNAISLGSGSYRFKDLYLSGSIYLGGTDSANALDDYEEGTWTPTFASTTGSFTTMTMDVITATYTKIGRQVVAKCFIRTDNVNTTGASGSLILDGLPFNSAAGNNGYSAVSVGFVRNFVNAVESGYVEGGTDHIVLQKNGTSSTAVPTDLTAGATDNQNNLMVTATYFV